MRLREAFTARKWLSESRDPDVAAYKSKFSRALGGLFKCLHAHPRAKQLVLLCPVSQGEVGKGRLLTFPPVYTSHRGRPSEAESQAGVGGCWGPGCWLPGSCCWHLFAPCLIAPAWEASLEHCCCLGRRNVLVSPFSGMRWLAQWRHSNQNGLNSDLVHFTTCAQGLKDWL